MGREATCACDWGGAKTEVKALLEPPELILRGSLRNRIPIAAMKQIRPTVTGCTSSSTASLWHSILEATWR